MPRSGLLAMKAAVANYFEVQQIPALVLIGLKARAEWARSRVVIIPGRFDGSETARPMAGGTVSAPTKKQSVNPRELVEDKSILTISIFAVDQANLQSEEAQIAALENLTESTIQAMWNAIDPVTKKNVGGPGLEWGDYLFVHPPTQLAYGRERLQYVAMSRPFFDLPQTVSVPTAGTLTKELTIP